MAVAFELFEARYSQPLLNLPTVKPQLVRVPGDPLIDASRIAQVGTQAFNYNRVTLEPFPKTFEDIIRRGFLDIHELDWRMSQDELLARSEAPARSAIEGAIWLLGLKTSEYRKEPRSAADFVRQVRKDPIIGSLALSGEAGLRQLLLYGQREVSLRAALDVVGIEVIKTGGFYTIPERPKAKAKGKGSGVEVTPSHWSKGNLATSAAEMRPADSREAERGGSLQLDLPSERFSEKQVQLTERWEKGGKEAIYNHLYRLIGNADDASDLASEVYLKGFKAIDRTADNLQLMPWMYRIATNLAMDKLRRRKLLRWEPLETYAAMHRPDQSANGDPLKSALRSAEKEETHRVLEKLPPKFRAVLVLYHMQGLRTEEIAGLLGTTHSAVKSLLFRAREEFRIVSAKLERAGVAS